MSASLRKVLQSSAPAASVDADIFGDVEAAFRMREPATGPRRGLAAGVKLRRGPRRFPRREDLRGFPPLRL